MKTIPPPPNDTWGVVFFLGLTRKRAFFTAYFFLVIVLVVSSFPLFSNIASDFVLHVLGKAGFVLVFIFLKFEGTCIKDWFSRRFVIHKGRVAYLVGLTFVFAPVCFAFILHRALLGDFPRLKEVPFSGFAFGIFLIYLINATFEDVSWRGYLLPRVLHLFPGFPSLVVLGLMWGWWHIPFHLTLDLIYPEQVFQCFIYFILMFFAFYVVFSLSEGSLVPLIFTHSLYNTVAFFTSQNILHVEGCSDIQVFYQSKDLFLALLVGVALFFLRRNKIDSSLNAFSESEPEVGLFIEPGKNPTLRIGVRGAMEQKTGIRSF